MRARRFCSDERGAVLVLFAFALPVLLAGISAAVEYTGIVERRAQLQSAADMAALIAAKGLTLANTNESVIETAKSTARAQLATDPTRPVPDVNSQVLNNRTAVEVTISESIPFMMGHYLGQPRADVAVKAVAKLSGGARRLCMLALEPSTLTEGIRLEMYAKITAEKCDVYSDSKSVEGIKAYNDTMLKAERICSAGGYKASRSTNFYPTPVTDCPPNGDPLAKRTQPSANAANCKSIPPIEGGWKQLEPGIYCGITVKSGGFAYFLPGDYTITGKLWVQNGGGVGGVDVSFYFHGDTALFDFDPDTFVGLSARKSGALAGILFFEDRNAPLYRKFRIASNNAPYLIGTIYLPRGMFYVGSNKPVGDKSAYTVVVARVIRMDAGPNLVLNANYSDPNAPPVPEGVGSNTSSGTNISLSQ